MHITKLTLISSSLHIIYSQDKFFNEVIITYYLSRICTFDLVKVWIFQIQLSAYLFLNRFLKKNIKNLFFDELLSINNIAILFAEFRG